MHTWDVAGQKLTQESQQMVTLHQLINAMLSYCEAMFKTKSQYLVSLQGDKNW